MMHGRKSIKSHILCSIMFFSENHAVYEIMWKNMVVPDRLQMTIRRMFYTGYLRLQTHTQNMSYLLLFHCNNGWKNGPQCYVIHTMAVLFINIWLSTCYTTVTPVSHYINPRWNLGYLCDIYGCQSNIEKGYLSYKLIFRYNHVILHQYAAIITLHVSHNAIGLHLLSPWLDFWTSLKSD